MKEVIFVVLLVTLVIILSANCEKWFKKPKQIGDVQYDEQGNAHYTEQPFIAQPKTIKPKTS